jgi:hypothetical protein
MDPPNDETADPLLAKDQDGTVKKMGRKSAPLILFARYCFV